MEESTTRNPLNDLGFYLHPARLMRLTSRNGREMWNECIGITATIGMPRKQKRDDGRERKMRGARAKRTPKWNQPKRLTGTEFPRGTQDLIVTGSPGPEISLAARKGFPILLSRSLPVHFGHSIYTFLRFAQLRLV